MQSEDGILNLRPDKVNSISFSDANFVTYQGSFYKLITKTKNFSIIKSIVLIAVEPDYQVGIQDKPNLRYKNANKLYIQIGAKKTLIKVNKKYISQLFEDSKQGEIKKFFKSKEYFQAHEEWEDLWSDYYLEDRKFVQALIQLSVSFYHVENENLNGAKSQLEKARLKFMNFKNTHREIDVEKLLMQIEKVSNNYRTIEKASDFNWKLVPSLD